MNKGWKTRIEERRYFEEKKKAQQENARARANLLRQWEREKLMMEISQKNGFWSAFA
jgi:hypothetical protein